eukprot:11258241-Alexandrium_andersonii.AAC.1
MADATAESAWQALRRGWLRWMGLPSTVVSDGGSEFAGVFADGLQSCGVIHHVTDANAPWQNGKTERHGAIFK